MGLIDELAQKIHQDIESEGGTKPVPVFFDPISISIYISIISAVIQGVRLLCQIKQNRLLQEEIDRQKYPNETLAERIKRECQEGTILARMKIAKEVREKMGFWQYLKRGRKVVDAVMRAGGEMSVEEINQLLDG